MVTCWTNFALFTNTDRQTKDVRLDILVRDKDNRIYNIEMQLADQDNLGRRMRYYLSKVDAHYTLEKKRVLQ